MKSLIFSFANCFLITICVYAQPVIQLSKKEVNFGIIYYGEEVKDTVYIRNTKRTDLIIKDIRYNDGGSMVYYWTRTPIVPTDSGIVVIGFQKDNGVLGHREQAITITDNFGGVHVINLKAQIKYGPLIKFEEDSLNVDTVIISSYPRRVFRFKNVGDEPLIIYNIKGSGQAMASDFPKYPILPNGSDSLVFVSFNDQIKEGRFIRTLVIAGNFQNGIMETRNKYDRYGFKIIKMTGYNKINH